MKQVLFLCSANYYRSRFAEHVFNWMAGKRGLRWQADSRGLAVGHWNVLGPISSFTIEALEDRQIDIDQAHREPIQLSEEDFIQSDLVIAVKETEHRPMLEDQFPQWRHAVQYWEIHDLDCAEPDEALPALESQVRDLVDQLLVSA